ncbi:alanine/glycine:cation symporter family protein [Calditerrivibrio nitroreducens]|uniref:Amino acid carrier protein n=1 Tax=Calditerrivibrio nitroreducens (strain DSM 19672 / NBRC 101217 / Yu37-1) TaxID=768670 RepID=E4TGP7_CALNY|nr:alanine/glycine:cation symporter family protein [Calditerrivibrio nitroreducens]ADR19760.1 amino acid carrier protein [Calditerrivibrio nitroreducens DSM 19672]
MDIMKFIDLVNNIVWSDALVYLCLITGLYFSIRMRFFQVRLIKDMIKHLISGKESKTGISSFQAFSMAVAGRVGTGNIAGVATAIAMGGPGAIFWMWVIAFFGAGSAFVEAVLAQIYKEERDGQYRGGPAYYIEKGLNIKWYAVLFALSTVIACGLLLPGVQAYNIGDSINHAFGIDQTTTGFLIVILLGIIIFGGVKRIAKTAEIIVPFMAIGYIIIALIILIANINQIPSVIATIIESAFGLHATFGGIVGSAISWGVKRGVYSNEAGQGTAPMAAATAEVSHPAKQGLVQAFSVYVDTLLVCSATAFMILITGKYNVHHPDGNLLFNNLPGIQYGPIYTQKAVETLFPSFGAPFVAIALFFFAFTTIMAYYYYSETSLAYLINNKSVRKYAINFLRAALLCSAFYGTIKTASFGWALGDIGVGIMAWINIIAILLLQKPAIKVLKDYEDQKAMGIDPVFDPEKLGIKNSSAWK